MKTQKSHLQFATGRFARMWLLGILFLVACSKTPVDPGGGNNPPINNPGVDVPVGANDGVTFINNGTSAIFNLYAPEKKTVSLIGDFNNWAADSKYALKNSKNGNRWWIQIDNLDPKKEYAYQYLIDGNIKIADPYAEKILDPYNDSYIPKSVYPDLKPYPSGQTEIVSVMQAQPASYIWKVQNFVRPNPSDLVIYELLIRDFVATHSYKTLIDTLDYLSRLGVNAIELLPVNEFEGNVSWGYNTNFGFALDKYYGTKNDFKAFVDACHERGIAVIQDIVLEHQFGSSPMIRMYATASGAPSANNPWFNTANRHPYAVGYQMNHDKEATQFYTKNVIKYWMQEYKIDGFRFDQSKAFTQKLSTDDATWSQYDAARIATLKNYHNYIKSIDPTFYLILEHFTVNEEEAELAKNGMLLWGNMSNAGQQAAMGYPDGNGTWDLSGIFYNRYGFSTPSKVIYFESHDEERVQFKNTAYGNASGDYSVKNLSTGLARDGMLAAFLFASPGPKLIWQFGERGYDISIGNGDERLREKPPHWEYMSQPDRKKLFEIYSELIRFKLKNSVFKTADFQYNLTGGVKTIQLNGSDGVKVFLIGNFNVTPQSVTIPFPATGLWFDNLGGKNINVASNPYSMTLLPGEYFLFSNQLLKK